MTVFAYTAWKSNAEMIAAVASLGYLRPEWPTLDATYGRGGFWRVWRPDQLVTNDRHTDADHRYDFTNLPADWAHRFAAVVFDPPYKLNGRPDPAIDTRYGVHERANRDERHALIADGLRECWRVTRPRGVLLVKCMDQVEGNRVRWQTRNVDAILTDLGCDLVDRFDRIGHRPQPLFARRARGLIGPPAPRRQTHAQRNSSTLLIFRKVAR